MTKQEMINMLILLSQMEGFILGKVGVHTLPDVDKYVNGYWRTDERD